MNSAKGRIEYLDGHRGLAILLVVFFHAYAGWPALFPYGDKYVDILIFKYGWLGVQLFFLISGFVILMTLERCLSVKEFLYRRWLRLFPAMFICSVIIFATSSYFFERPAGIPTWTSLLPGLTFIEPGWWSRVLGFRIVGIEGAFWSLYVEFKFYVFSAIVYYWKGRDALIRGLLLVFIVSVLLRLVDRYFGMGGLGFLELITSALSFRYFGWFASGAAFYIFSQNKSAKWFAIAVLIAVASALFEGGGDWQKTFATSMVSIFFATSAVVECVRSFLSNRFLQFFGGISYPLYLIHENMMISIIIKIGDVVDGVPMILLPLPVILMLSAAALLICKYFEPFLRSILEDALMQIRSLMKSSVAR